MGIVLGAGDPNDVLRLSFLGLSSVSNPDRDYTRWLPIETCFLGADLRNADTPSLPCGMFSDAESLGRAGTTGILGWSGTGTLVVLISRMKPSFSRRVTIAWSIGKGSHQRRGPGSTLYLAAPWPSTLARVVMRVRSHLVGLGSEV